MRTYILGCLVAGLVVAQCGLFPEPYSGEEDPLPELDYTAPDIVLRRDQWIHRCGKGAVAARESCIQTQQLQYNLSHHR